MKTYLFWIDCEMTGLDWNNDHIIEIAYIITDFNCSEIIAKNEYIIFQTNDILTSMNEWCKKHHSQSQLIEKVQNSKISYSDVENNICKELEKLSKKNTTIYITGNSVYNDVVFLKKYIPKIFNFLHYRIIDISSLKIISQEKYHINFEKQKKHRALDDIQESIHEYQFYLKNIFK